MRIGDVSWDLDTHEVACARCSGVICRDDQNWKEHSLVVRKNAAERLNDAQFGATFRVHEHPDVELAEIFCPHCEALLSVELYVTGEPFRWTYQSLDVARRRGYDPVAEMRNAPDQWLSF